MTTEFKVKSFPVAFSLASLILFVVGGPMLWTGAFAAISAPQPAWAFAMLSVGGVICGVAYSLFVLGLASAFVTMAARILRARRTSNGEPRHCVR